MSRILTIVLFLCLYWTTAIAQAPEKQTSTDPPGLSPEDQKVVSVLDILQLMDLTEEMDMFKDMNYLIEDAPNETQKD